MNDATTSRLPADADPPLRETAMLSGDDGAEQRPADDVDEHEPPGGPP